jgi:fatty acid-binding protein DegV
MRTTIVTDSSAWYDIAPVPWVDAVSIGISLPTADGLDTTISPEQVRSAIVNEEPVKTRAPSAIDYLAAIEAADADGVVVLTPAAAITAMWKNACAAVYLSDRPAVVVDTGTAGAAQRLVVEVAASAAQGGAELTEVVRLAEQTARRAELIAVLGSTEPIQRTGILVPPSVRPGRRDRRHPLFRFAAGAIEPLHVPSATADPARILQRSWESDGGPLGETPLVFCSGADDAADRLVAGVGGRGPVAVSPSVMAYTGPVVLGLAWLSGGRSGTRPSG